jgi:DNA-binding MarR family transcriptional regulator
MLDRLERAQFIRRKTNPDDRRGVLIEITKKWIETAGPLVRGVQQAHAELIASYSDEELEIIADFLTRFTNNVTEHTKMIEKDLT